jgi:hypothetical protein
MDKNYEAPTIVDIGSLQGLTLSAKDLGFNDGTIFIPTGTPIGTPSP